MLLLGPVTLSRSGGVTGNSRPLKKFPQILCGFFIFLYTLFFLYRAVVALLYAYPMEYGEGAVFHEAGQLFRDGFNPASLYPANEAPPYRAGIYTPLYYYWQALTMAVTGPASFLGGRLVTLGAALYTGLALYRAARAEELAPGRRGGFALGLAAALTPFATSALYAWGVLAKADLLALALSLAAVRQAWQTEAHRRQGRGLRPYIVAGILCALALLTKQSALAAPATLFLWLGLWRQWRELGAFLGALLATGGAASLFFELASGRQFFRHVISYNAQPFDLEFLGAGLQYFVLTHLVLLVLAVFWLVRPLIGRYERVGLWRIYFLTALAVSFSAGKVGSNFNYYLESLCLVSLLAWWQVGRLSFLRPVLRLGPFQVSLYAFSLVFMALQLLNLHHVPLLADGANTPGPARFKQARHVAAQVRDMAGRGPLLAEDSGWQAVLGLPVELDDPFVFGQLAAQGTWDSRPFLDKLKNGYYRSAVFEISDDLPEAELEQAVRANRVTPFPRRFSPEVLAVLLDRTKYEPVGRVGPYLFLAWKETPGG